MHSWAEDKKPLRLIEKEVPKGDPDPKALACYGLWLAEEDMREMLLRFVDGRPISSVTTRYLEWCCCKLWERGKRVMVLVWDNAPWHVSKEVSGSGGKVLKTPEWKVPSPSCRLSLDIQGGTAQCSRKRTSQ
jgi:hypothetical protein